MDHKKACPVYVVTGALSSGKTTFIQNCIQRRESRKDVLLVQFEKGLAVPSDQALYIPIRETQMRTDEELAARIAQEVCLMHPDEIWIEWNGMLPAGRLLSILSGKELQLICRLHRVIQVADAPDYLSLLSRTDSFALEQVTQCDLVVARNSDKKQLRKIRHSLRQVSSSLYVLDFEDDRQIDTLLYYKNIKEPLRVMTVLEIVIAALFVVSFLKLSIPDSISVYLGTYLQAIPFLLLGILLSSLIQVFVPEDFIRRIFPKNAVGGMFFGLVGGLFMPICDCASIPVFRSLVKKGVPLSAAVVFMAAAPVINPVVMLSTYYAFGGNLKIMLARIILGMISAFVIGLFFIRQKESIFSNGLAYTACACCRPYAMKSGAAAKIRQLMSHFRSELFEVAKYLLIGIGVSTFLQTVLGSDLTSLGAMGIVQAMLLMMLMAFLLSLCSSSDAVIGKNMGINFPMGAVMGFMVFGPMMDIKNLILLSASMSKRFIIKLTIVIFAVCFAVVYGATLLGLEGIVQ